MTTSLVKENNFRVLVRSVLDTLQKNLYLYNFIWMNPLKVKNNIQNINREEILEKIVILEKRWLCESPFHEGDNIVRGHCDATRASYGTAHANCSLIERTKNFSPMLILEQKKLNWVDIWFLKTCQAKINLLYHLVLTQKLKKFASIV